MSIFLTPFVSEFPKEYMNRFSDLTGLLVDQHLTIPICLYQWMCFPLLVACARLYKTLCLSVTLIIILRILLFQGLQRLNIAPAQPHATDVAVYTAFLKLRLSDGFALRNVRRQ